MGGGGHPCPDAHHNDGARDALNVDVLHTAPTYSLDGSGVDVLVYDGGQVGDHPDFGVRLTHGDAVDVSDHSTHVAGTVAGDGSESAGDGGAAWQWRGMAPNADIVSYAYQWDQSGTLFYTNMGDINNDWDDAKNVHGAAGLGGRFMNEDYSPLKSASSASNDMASLATYSATHPLMSGVSAAGALSHLDVLTTGGDVEVLATWDSGEEFVALKRQDPAPIPGRVIAVNAPLEDGQWTGDLDEIVTNAIQWLSDNARNLPWLEVSCSAISLPPEPYAASAVNYTCPLVNSGDDWGLALTFDGSPFDPGDVVEGLTLRGKVTIEHNASEQERVNVPVSAEMVLTKWIYLPVVIR